MSSLKSSKPARSHKSKKDKAKKSSVRIINDGFIERSKAPQVTGSKDGLQSRMMRVDISLANYMREQAKKNGKSITEVSRDIYHALGGK